MSGVLSTASLRGWECYELSLNCQKVPLPGLSSGTRPKPEAMQGLGTYGPLAGGESTIALVIAP